MLHQFINVKLMRKFNKNYLKRASFLPQFSFCTSNYNHFKMLIDWKFKSYNLLSTFCLISSWGPWGFCSTSARYNFSIRRAICNSWGCLITGVGIVVVVAVEGGGVGSGVGSVATRLCSSSFLQNLALNELNCLWKFSALFFKEISNLVELYCNL